MFFDALSKQRLAHGFLRNKFKMYFLFRETMDARYYCDVLEQGLLENDSTIFEDVWTLVQENASVQNNKSQRKLDWLGYKNMCTFEWPAKFLHLNIIENVWYSTFLLVIFIHIEDRSLA